MFTGSNLISFSSALFVVDAYAGGVLSFSTENWSSQPDMLLTN
jgi:hypothetical protein